MLAALALAAALPAILRAEPTRPPPPVLFAPAKQIAKKPEDKEVVRVELSADGKVLYLIGGLEEGSYLRFARLLRSSARVETVYLASPVGRMLEGMLIGNLVHHRGLRTYVGYACSSACVLIFAAGRERILGGEAALGLHQSYIMAKDGGIPTANSYESPESLDAMLAGPGRAFILSDGDDVWVNRLRRIGASDEFIRHVLATAANDMWYPSQDELLAQHLATSVAATELYRAPPGIGRSMDEVRAKMLELAVWQVLKAHEAERFEGQVLKVWRFGNSGMDWLVAEAIARSELLDGVADRIARAPDALLGEFVSYFAGRARSERARNYSMCLPVHHGDRPASEIARDLVDEDADRLVVALLNNSLWQELDDAERAQKALRKNAARIGRSGAVTSYDAKNEFGYCKIGLQMFEAIDTLDAKRRLAAGRALFTLSALAAAIPAEE